MKTLKIGALTLCIALAFSLVACQNLTPDMDTPVGANASNSSQVGSNNGGGNNGGGNNGGGTDKPGGGNGGGTGTENPNQQPSFTISNIRYSDKREGTYNENKANWNPGLIIGNEPHIAFDINTDDDNIVIASIEVSLQLAVRNNTIGIDKIATTNPLFIDKTYFASGMPLNEEGTWLASVVATDSNGKTATSSISVTVGKKPNPGEINQGGTTGSTTPVLKKITFEQTGLPASIKPSDSTEYYEYGSWPQSLKEGGVAITAEIDPVTKYYKGNDGEWYEGVTGNGIQYFKVEPIVWQRIPGTNKLISAKILDSRIFYGGPTIKRVNMNYRVHAEAWYYIRRAHPSNYYYSDIRAWLNGIRNASLEPSNRIVWVSAYNIIAHNNYQAHPTSATGFDNSHIGSGFIDKAFTEVERKSLQYVNVTLTARAAHMDAVQKNYDMQDSTFLNDADSWDRVWLWSKQEITTSAYGFSTQDTRPAARKKPLTDYAAARVLSRTNSGADNGTNYNAAIAERNNRNGTTLGAWWLRSPEWKSEAHTQSVDADGYAKSGSAYASVDDKSIGVVPGIQLPSKMFQ